MKGFDSVLNFDEKVVFSLRSLYSKYGYAQYKMSKFEEYELYVRNKDFLISDSVITFTDTNGKLMALKPDVTLSIIKNSKDSVGCVQKTYYNENVYRVSTGTRSFKEIMQVGLECIGDIDDYLIYEVLMLAAKSLNEISDNAVLDISSLDLLTYMIEDASSDRDIQKKIMKCFGEKNAHELQMLCDENGVDREKTDALKQLIGIYGTPDEVLPKLEAISSGRCKEACQRLKKVVSAFDGSPLKDMIHIDFSVVSDMKYYSGVVFKGFVKEVPESILSGGQYDKLMQKMNRGSKAIGFAVYLDLLERLGDQTEGYDTDILLLYGDDIEITTLGKEIEKLTNEGKTVVAQRTLPEKIRYRQLVEIDGEGVKVLETNA